MAVPLALLAGMSSASIDPRGPERLPGWFAVTSNLTVHVAVGLLNRREARPAAMYTTGTWDCSHPWLSQARLRDPTANRTDYRNVTGGELLEVAIERKAALGAVLWSGEMLAVSAVVTLCGVHRALPVADESEAAWLGLPVVFDARKRWATALEATQWTVSTLLPNTSRHALVLQNPPHLATGFLADLAVAGWPGDAEDLPLLAIWPEDPADPGMVLPSICNATAPEHKLFGDLTEGALGIEHGWIGPGIAGRTMPTVIGYHTTGPGAWTECVSLCTPQHRTISLVAMVASNLAFLSRAAPLSSLPAPHPVVDPGPFDHAKSYVTIVNSDGDNLAFDEVRAPGIGGGNSMDDRVAACSKPGAVCPPVAHTMSNRLLNLAPTVLQWWYDRATPSDSFLMGPSGYGYVYPARMEPEDQAAFANATVQAAAALGMEGYVHWDWLLDWGKPLIPHRGAGALAFLQELSKASSGDFAALVQTVPDVVKPSHVPPLVGPGSLAVVKPTSYLHDHLGTWTHGLPAKNVSDALLALEPGEITYVYKIWSVSFADVEAVGVALRGSHVQLVDYRALAKLTREKQRWLASRGEQ